MILCGWLVSVINGWIGSHDYLAFLCGHISVPDLSLEDFLPVNRVMLKLALEKKCLRKVYNDYYWLLVFNNASSQLTVVYRG